MFKISKDTWKETILIAMPAMIESFFSAVASVIDSKMVSAIGVSAISAVSVTNQPRLFTFSVFFAINTVHETKDTS